MRCVVPNSGIPEIIEREIAPLDSHEVQIQIAAIGINRADIYQTQGNYPPPEGASDILGLECSGTIIAMGDKVKTHAVGDEVCALVQGGAYAEAVNVPEWRALQVPKNVSLEHAAALPEACFTAYYNMMEKARLKPGESILIHGGTSGVGSIAIQMAAAYGAQVYATAGSDEKCQRCLDLGASLAINYKNDDFVAVLKEHCPDGVNVVIDMVGGDYMTRNCKVMAENGRLVSIAFINGSKTEVNFAPFFMKNLTLMGSTLRNRNEEEIYNLAQSLRTMVWPWVEEGSITPLIDSTYALGEVQQAHARMEDFAHSGKILLIP